MKNVACFDIGGTFIKYAIINSEGEILFKDKAPTPDYNCKDTIPEKLIKIIEKLKEIFPVHAVGISTAGLVDSEKGIIISSSNLHEYSGARLVEKIKGNTGLDTYIENDVRSAAIGELWKGAGKEAKNFVCLTLGTGVGGAIVVDGKILKGVGGIAGEIGHLILAEKGEECGCGVIGCYERYASTSALIRLYKRKAEEKGTQVEDIDGEEILKRFHSGEELAKEVYNEFLEHVVTGLISITHLLDPGLIIVGGGISAQGEPFFKELNERFNKRAMKVFAEHTSIVQAKLENDAGIYGACYIAL